MVRKLHYYCIDIDSFLLHNCILSYINGFPTAICNRNFSLSSTGPKTYYQKTELTLIKKKIDTQL